LMALGVIGVSVYYGPTASRPKVSIVLPEADQAHRQAAQGIERVGILPTVGLLPDPDREVLMPVSTAAPVGKQVENRIRETVPAAAGKEPGRQPDAFPLTRKVREGENLYRMILEVYGASTPELWDLVREHNPKIKGDLKILVGQKIVFPERESLVKDGEVKKEGAEGSRVQGVK
jgi:hypothetical protein